MQQVQERLRLRRFARGTTTTRLEAWRPGRKVAKGHLFSETYSWYIVVYIAKHPAISLDNRRLCGSILYYLTNGSDKQYMNGPR